jgi:uncharacterized protein YegP (UPF0339 family)
VGTSTKFERIYEELPVSLKADYFQDKQGEWRFTIRAANGEPVAQSEGYADKRDARKMGQLLTKEPPEVLELEPAEARGPTGILAGRRLPPREMAMLMHTHGWTDYEKLMTGVAVMLAESEGYAEAVGPLNENGTQDYGWMQLNSGHRGSMSLDDFIALAFDPERAVVFGRQLYLRAGYSFRPWYAWTNGTWEKYTRPKRATLGVANYWAERSGWVPSPYYRSY